MDQRIIGESSTLCEALQHVSLVAPLNRPVIVMGERGSGKELIAERLHYLSPRWEQTLDKVNCAAISEPLLDSELFGHEKGAFTGAESQHLGRFERADGGTLFLDELATMPMRIQEKLLRLIEYGEFERLGGQQTIQVDVRIVAATNANLPRMAEENTFRRDLLDRLAFDVIQVPPLRQRQSDIPELVAHFAVKMCQELSWDYFSGFSAEAMQQLQSYAWPGNVRELKNVVERSLYRWGSSDVPVGEIILSPFGEFESASDTLEVAGEGGQKASDGNTMATHRAGSCENGPAASFSERVKSYELSLLRQGLLTCQGHQKRTAELLGLTYHQLRALLKKYKCELDGVL